MKIYRYQLPLRQFLLLALFITLSFTLARWIHLYWQVDGVLAAVMNALLWALIPASWLFSMNISRFLLLDAVYVGSFIALDTFINGLLLSLSACVIASIIYLISNRLLTGLGGRLGMQAFMSCVMLMGIHTCLSL